MAGARCMTDETPIRPEPMTLRAVRRRLVDPTAVDRSPVTGRTISKPLPPRSAVASAELHDGIRNLCESPQATSSAR